MTMTFFERVGPRGRVQQVLNVLVESPFFYPADDPELFAFLVRHQGEVARFFEESFGWQLVVEARLARLYKPRWHNEALKRSQHDAFALTRKDDCVAFLLLLDFHERLLEERGASIDDEPLRFEMGELFAHAKGRLASIPREEGSEDRLALDDDGARRLFRELVPQLLRYRFLREVPREPADDAISPDRWLYECLAGLAAYDVRVLDDRVIEDVLREAAA
jgi:hypothetical protein